MSCQRFRAAITAYAAGDQIEAAAGRHLDGCLACRERLAAQRRLLAELDAELRGSLALSASPEFVANVTRAARPSGEWRRSWSAPATWTGLAAAAAIVLAVFIRQGAVDPSRPDVRFEAEATKARGVASDVRLKPEASSKPPSPQQPVASASRRRTSSAPRERIAQAAPPVIVEPARAQAILRLRELMIAGRLDGDMLPPPRTPEAALAELLVAPLGVSEIKVPDAEIVSRPPAAPDERQ